MLYEHKDVLDFIFGNYFLGRIRIKKKISIFIGFSPLVENLSHLEARILISFLEYAS